MDSKQKCFEVHSELKNLISEAIDEFCVLIEENPLKFSREELLEIVDNIIDETNPDNFIKNEDNPIDYLHKNLDNRLVTYFSKNESLHNSLLEIIKCKLDTKNHHKFTFNINKQNTSEEPKSENSDVQIANFHLEITTSKENKKYIAKRAVTVTNAVEKTFIYAKIYTDKPQENYEFVMQILELVKSYIIMKSNNILNPETKVMLGNKCIYLEIENVENHNLIFYMLLWKKYQEKAPCIDININLEGELGNKFRNSSNEDSEIPLLELLSGAKINVDMENNISELIKIFNKNFIIKNSDPFLITLGFLIGSISLNSGLELNLGLNDLKRFFALNPNYNIFGDSDLLKNIKELKAKEDSILNDLLNVLSGFKEKVEVVANCPFAAMSLELNIVGITDFLKNILEKSPSDQKEK